MRKRLLSALLAMAMVLTMLPMSAFAAGTPEITGIGYAEKAADAGTAIAAILDEIRTTHSWTSDCDDQTMYITVQGLEAATKYNVKVSDSQGQIWTNKTALESKTGKNGDNNLVIYFTFNQASKENPNASVAERAVAAGEYTVALVDESGNAVEVEGVAVTKKVELEADGKGGFKVKDNTPAQKEKITAVDVKMTTTAIEVGGTLPVPTVETTPADAATVAVAWTLNKNLANNSFE